MSSSSPCKVDDTHITASKHVLVTTDAIAYGLNMNVRRIILTTTRKFDGSGMVDLPQSTVLQVAGRAGRYGMRFSKEGGSVTVLHERDLPAVRDAFAAPLPPISRAGLLPTSDIIAIYADLKKKEGVRTFAELMTCFTREVDNSNDLLFPCDMSRSVVAIAKALDGIRGLDLKDRVLFCFAPLSDTSNESFAMLRGYAERHAAGELVPMQFDEQHLTPMEASVADPKQAVQRALKGGTPISHGDVAAIQLVLSSLEWVYKMAEVYGWLSWRFGHTFLPQEEAKGAKERTVRAISTALEALHAAQKEATSHQGGDSHRRKLSPIRAPEPSPVNEELIYTGASPANNTATRCKDLPRGAHDQYHNNRRSRDGLRR